MELTYPQIGIMGDASDCAAFRIEFATRVTSTGVALDVLHDEEMIGGFARVFRGQVRQGGFRLPVAIKVQRDTSLTKEQSISVAAKFDAERLAYRRLQNSDSPQTDSSVVRQFDIGNDSNSIQCDSLPACIVCPYARHSLQPTCPSCRGPLQVDPYETVDHQRRLFCPSCSHSSFPNTAAAKTEIIRATVRLDDACHGCQQSDDICSASARFLQFFPSRVLTLELLDLDLEDFIAEEFQPSLQDRHREFWANFHDARGSLTEGRTTASGLHLFKETLGIFNDILMGVRQIHRNGDAHFDLKPRNICLTFANRNLTAKVIDLGYVRAPDSVRHLNQIQAQREITTDYAAPEVQRMESPKYHAHLYVKENEPRLELDHSPLEVKDPLNPLLSPGDVAHITIPPPAIQANITRIGWKGSKLVVCLSDDRAATTLPVDSDVTVTFQKAAGPPADYYSLGIILFALLSRDTLLRPIVNSLVSWWEALNQESHDPTNSQLVPCLLAQVQSDNALHRLVQRLNHFGPAKPLALELLAVALRLTLRGRAKGFRPYLTNRVQSISDVLPRLEHDLRSINSAFLVLEARELAREDRDRLIKAIPRFKEKVQEPSDRHGRYKAVSLPQYDGQRITNAVRRSLGDSSSLSHEVAGLLADYGGRRDWLIAHLDRFEAEDDVQAEQLGQLGLDHKILVDTIRLSMQRNVTVSILKAFTARRERLRLNLDATRLSDAEKQPYRDWLQRTESLFAAIRAFDNALSPVRWFIIRLTNLFLNRIRRESSRDNLRPLEFLLGEDLRATIDDTKAIGGIAAAAEQTRFSVDLLDRLRRDFTQCLEDWTKMPKQFQASLKGVEENARQRQTELEEQHKTWLADFRSAKLRLDGFLYAARAEILDPWDRAARPGFFARLLGRTRTRLVLDVQVEHVLSRYKAMGALKQLKLIHLGPAALFQATLFVEELQSFLALRALG